MPLMADTATGSRPNAQKSAACAPRNFAAQDALLAELPPSCTRPAAAHG